LYLWAWIVCGFELDDLLRALYELLRDDHVYIDQEENDKVELFC